MFKDFLRGRNGLDSLNKTLLIAGLIVSYIPNAIIIGYAMIGVALFRTLSKDIQKRQLEQAKFLQYTYKIRTYFVNIFNKSKKDTTKVKSKYSKWTTKQKQKKDYVFFKCPNCKKNLRLPKGKGKVEGKCPMCEQKFIKKT